MTLVPCLRRRGFRLARFHTVAVLPCCLLQLIEAEAAHLADQAIRKQQKEQALAAWAGRQHAGRSGEGASPTQTTHRILCGTQDPGPLFHWSTVEAMRRLLSSFRAGTGVRYGAAPPRTFNELSDQWIEALICLIVLIELSANGPAFATSSSQRPQETFGFIGIAQL